MSFFETIEQQLIAATGECHAGAVGGGIAPDAIQPSRRSRRVRRFAVAAVVLASLAVVALALLPGRKGKLAPPGSPVAAQAARACSRPATAPPCFAALAHVASAQQALAAGRVWYQRDRWVLSGVRFGPEGASHTDRALYRPLKGAREIFQIVVTAPQQVWLAADGSGRIDYRGQSKPSPQSAADRAAWKDAGAPNLTALVGPIGNWGPKVQNFSRGELTGILLGGNNLEAVTPKHDPLGALPTDPRRLEATLRGWAWRQRIRAADRARCTRTLTGCRRAERRLVQDTFTGDIATFLRYPLTPPRLRTALLRVCARLRGTRNVGRVRDPVGRSGVALELPGAGIDGDNILLFDAKTSELLAIGSHGPQNFNGRLLTLAGDDGPPTAANIRWRHLYRLRTGEVTAVGHAPTPQR